MVSHVNDQTQVQIETSHDEGAINMHGTQRTMNALLQALREQPSRDGCPCHGTLSASK